MGNKNLPVPETEFQWTPEMVEDLERARKSILHFSRFFYIVSLDEGKQPIVVGVAVIVERGAKEKVESAGLKYLAAYQLSDLGL